MKNQWDRQAYQKAFSQLKISPELRKELLAMTEKTEKTRKPKKFAMRRLAVAAAVMALAVALAMGANAATGGELYELTIGQLVCTLSTDDGGKAELYENGDGSFTIIEHPDDADDETAESSGNVVCARTYEVEIDEDGNMLQDGSGEEPADSNGENRKIIAAQGESGLEIGVKKGGAELTRPIEELAEGAGEIVSLLTEDGESSLLGLPWLYDPVTRIDGYRQRGDGRYDVVVQDITGELKIIVTDEIPFFIRDSTPQE